MFKWPIRFAAAALAGVVGLHPMAGRAQQETELIFAIPAQTLTFSAHFVAHDMGFFKKEGLKVSDRYLVGVASPNAVLAGSADFTIGTGPVFLRAAAKGQKFKAIANLVDKPLVELVLRKDVADAAGITDKTPPVERAKALKGKTIAIQGVGSIVHAWQRYVTMTMAGLDVEKDVRIQPMDPPAMLPALQTKAIDGYATSMPFTTLSIVNGAAIMVASSTFDAPDLHPFAYAMVYSRPDYCKDKADLCTRVVRAYQGAAKMIQEKPDEVFETVLKKRLKTPPDLLAMAWKVAQTAHAKDVRVTRKQLENAQKINLGTKLIEPTEVVTNYEELFTDEFVK